MRNNQVLTSLRQLPKTFFINWDQTCGAQSTLTIGGKDHCTGDFQFNWIVFDLTRKYFLIFLCWIQISQTETSGTVILLSMVSVCWVALKAFEGVSIVHSGFSLTAKIRPT